MSTFLHYSKTFIFGFFEGLLVLTLLTTKLALSIWRYLVMVSYYILWKLKLTNKKYRIIKYKEDGTTEIIYK